MKYSSNHVIHESVVIRQKTAILFVLFEIYLDTHKLLFQDVRGKDRPKQIEFMGIPFIIMGNRKFDCTHGVKRNRLLFKRFIYLSIYIYIYILFHALFRRGDY